MITYLRCTEHFLRKVAKPPDELTRDDVRDYLLWLKRRGIAPASRNLSLTAIRFLGFQRALRSGGDATPRGIEHQTFPPMSMQRSRMACIRGPIYMAEPSSTNCARGSLTT